MRLQWIFICLALFAPAAAAQDDARVSIFPQTGNTSGIDSVSFSGDSTLLATAGSDTGVVIWNLPAGRQWRILPATPGAGPIQLSRDGGTLVSPEFDAAKNHWAAISVWSVRRRARLRRFAVDNYAGGQIAVSSDGRFVAAQTKTGTAVWNASTAASTTLAANGPLAFDSTAPILAVAAADSHSSRWSVQLWNVSSDTLVRRVDTGTAIRQALVFSPDGEVIALQRSDGSIGLWSVRGGAPLANLTGRRIAFSPDSKLAVATNDGPGVVIWDSARRSSRVLNGDSRSEYSLAAFSRNGRTLYASSQPGADLLGRLGIWDARSERLVSNQQVDDAFLTARPLAFSPDGRTLVFGRGGGDNTLRVWSLDSDEKRILGGVTRAVTGAAFSPQTNTLAVSYFDGTGTLWSWDDEHVNARTVTLAPFCNHVAFDPTGRTLACFGGGSSVVVIVDAVTGQQVEAIDVGGGRSVTALAFSPQTPTLAIGVMDQRDFASHVIGTIVPVGVTPPPEPIPTFGTGILIRDTRIKRTLRTIQTYDTHALAFSPDGKTLAAGWAGGLKLFNASDGAEIAPLLSRVPIETVVFAPDGAKVAVTGPTDPDATPLVEVLDVVSRQTTHILRSQTHFVSSVAFSPDGRTLATGSWDHTIKLWDVASGSALHSLVGHLGWVRMVSFARDGRALVSAADDGTARVWDADHGDARTILAAFNDGSSIAATPEGFFASSGPQAEENLNVRIGDHVYGIAAFRENFYRPDLVRRSLRGEDLSHYGDIADVKLAPEIELADVPANTSEPTLTIGVTLTESGGGIGAVRLFRDGTAVVEDDTASGSTRGYTIPLAAGTNHIRVAASSADGGMWSETSATVVANDNAPPRKGTLHVLIVGVNRFPRLSDKQQLLYAVADAKLVEATIRAHAAPLFDALDIKMLSTVDETKRQTILGALKAMQGAVQPDDAFVFFVASHGQMAGGEFYLATSDTSLGGLESEAISRRELTELLANFRTTRKAVFVDACQAGALEGQGEADFATTGRDANDAATVLSRQLGLTMFLAATIDEKARGGPSEQHGLFSSVLADGLAGGAADPKTGLVATNTLATYVEDQVPKLANDRQHPTASLAGQPFAISQALSK